VPTRSQTESLCFYTKTAKLGFSDFVLPCLACFTCVCPLVFSIFTIFLFLYLLHSFSFFLFASLLHSVLSIFSSFLNPLHCLPCVLLRRFKLSALSLILLRDARYHTDRSSPFHPWTPNGWESERIQSRTRRTQEDGTKPTLRAADKFIPSRERRDIGMRLYRRLGKIRCQIGTAREKLPMDVSFKNPLSARVSSAAGSLSISNSSTVPWRYRRHFRRQPPWSLAY